jgi:uncharacterized protein (DUF169 family)
MSDLAILEQHLTDALSLTRRPVAIAFCESPPPGIARLAGTQPSGCSFWRLAAAGQIFYTLPSDHYNCPVGSYIHSIPLPENRQPELMQTLSIMVDAGYLRMEEVPGIPRLRSTPAVTVYAPLALTPVDPDVVLISGTPARLMCLHEAAVRANVAGSPLLGRPTCMAIPAALSTGAASSLGCIGNRVYTGIPDDELFTVISGQVLESVIDQLDIINAAHATLTEYHAGRRATLASA